MKVRSHTLQKYPYTRTRLAVTLNGADGTKLVFVTSKGDPRKDKKPNMHRMFKTRKTGNHPYFKVCIMS